MLLVQKLEATNSEVINVGITNRKFLNMIALKKDMHEHPERYNVNMEYSLIEVRPFLKVTRPTTVKVEQTRLFEKE